MSHERRNTTLINIFQSRTSRQEKIGTDVEGETEEGNSLRVREKSQGESTVKTTFRKRPEKSVFSQMFVKGFVGETRSMTRFVTHTVRPFGNLERDLFHPSVV